MANGKKSFVLYCDLINSVDHLTNEELGVLFKHILEYVNDKDPVLEDRLLLTAWKPIERSLKADLEKWEYKVEKRREAGRKGGLAKASNAKQELANLADSVNVTDTVNEDTKVSIVRKFKHLSINNQEYNKLLEQWRQEQVDEILDSIENYSKNTKYTSLYLTARKWLNKQYPTQPQDLPPIDKIVAVCALQSDQELERLKTKGYTLEQIKKYAQ